jgi:hypothetical protein
VNSNTFQKLLTYLVDGNIYAQPLYVPGLTVGGATHNVVFVATENNSVYAFDADSSTGANGGLLWSRSFNVGTQGYTITPVPGADVNCYDQGLPVNGITGTPVIDMTTYTLYAVAKTKEVAPTSQVQYRQRLHAIDLITGAEKFGGPVALGGTVPGSCGYTDGKGNVQFNSRTQQQRPALTLSNGVVYIGWGSHCDVNKWNGWLMGYDAATLKQVAIWATTPDDPSGTCKGAIWMSGGGPSVDTSGNLFLTTGNGGFNANIPGGRSYGDSFVKLTPGLSGGLTVADYFTPFYQATLDNDDFDLGSQGPLLLPDQPGATPHLMISANKVGTIYLVNRDNLGGFNTTTDHIVQELPHALSGTAKEPSPGPVYIGNKIYFAASADTIKAFQISSGRLTRTPVVVTTNTLSNRGAGLWATSDPAGRNPIIWALEPAVSGGILHAYKADLTELYDSTQNLARDGIGPGIKFAMPVVTGGKVYIGAQGKLVVFGTNN